MMTEAKDRKMVVGQKLTSGLMLPPPARPAKRKRPQTILEEDDWTAKLEAIIQRDYFPDIPKLESELEWLGAIKTKDPGVIRQAQVNIANRRAGLKTPANQTPAYFATPGTGLRTNLQGDMDLNLYEQRDPAQAAILAPEMSLDQFAANFTSADNASFDEIMEGINKRKRERHAWLYKEIEHKKAKLLEDSQSKELLEARPLDGFGTSGQPTGSLISWPYDPKNNFFYSKSAVPYTDKELAEQVQGAAKQIKTSATRLSSTIIDDSLLEAEKRRVRGDEYEEIPTPSFTPGPDQSPIMTWGEIEATPIPIQDDEDKDLIPPQELNKRAQPEFRIQPRKARDKAALRLADGARLNLQRRAALMSPAAVFRRTPRNPSTATPYLGSTGLGRTPAAHRLANTMRTDRAHNTDMQLKSAYSLSGPKYKRSENLASETPAILHDEDDFDFGHDKARSQTPFEAEVRDKALKAAETEVRKKALKAVEPVVHRREALRAFSRIEK